MRTDEAYVDNPEFIVNLHHKPVFVASNIEDHPVVLENARVTVAFLYILRTSPIRCSGFSEPGLYWLFGLPVSRPKTPKRAAGDNSHQAKASMVPFWEQTGNLPIMAVFDRWATQLIRNSGRPTLTNLNVCRVFGETATSPRLSALGRIRDHEMNH